jgi:hypothetical protein
MARDIRKGDVCTECGATVRYVTPTVSAFGNSMDEPAEPFWDCDCLGFGGPTIADD